MAELELILHIVLCYLIATVQISFAAQVNRTIDDTNGDSATGAKPTYLPSSSWADATCKGCAIQPNPSSAFEGSWTASTYHPSNDISFQFGFTGTAIYVFFIVPNTAATGVTTQAECNFILDGQSRGIFSHVPTSSLNYIYNAPVFSITNLPNINHVLNVSTSGLSYSVFINFDYAIYTFDDTLPGGPPPSSSPPNPGSNSNPGTSSTVQGTSNIQSSSKGTTSSTNPSSTASTVPTDTPNTTSGGSASASSPSGPSSPTHSSGPGMNLIAGAAGGSVGAVILLIAFFILCRRRRLKNEAARSLSSTVHASTVIYAYTGHPTSDLRPSQEDNNMSALLGVPVSKYSRQRQQQTGLSEGRLQSERLLEEHVDTQIQQEQQPGSPRGRYPGSEAPPEYSPIPSVH